jgi:bifunctional non-homologous end joining protein LigD
MPDVDVSHPERVVFPDIGLTKGEIVEYYVKVADLILPHLRGRPLTMEIFSKGVGEPGSFIKERRKHFPDWVGSASVPISDATKKKRGDELLMPVIDTADALKYVANQGMVTPHVWLSRADLPHHPDRLVFDLDPSTDDLAPIKHAALELRERLAADGLVPYVKTTGGRGLHVTVPLDRAAGRDEVRAYAEAVAADLSAAFPDRYTTEFSKAARGDRLYLDILRNGGSQTEVCAYGIRGRAGAPVAAPIEWDEVKTFTPGKWNVGNLFRRLSKRDDPWKDLDRDARRLP